MANFDKNFAKSQQIFQYFTHCWIKDEISDKNVIKISVISYTLLHYLAKCKRSKITRIVQILQDKMLAVKMFSSGFVGNFVLFPALK